jgi:SET domain-containing protein
MPDDDKFYEIRGSEIHGRGLFARKFIPKDTWIVEYIGEKIDKAESERRADVLLEKSKTDGSARVFTFVLNDQWDIDGGHDYNDARLINHSCDPNVEAQIWDGKEIWCVALRDIQPGEELFYNYGFDLDNWDEHPCRCGSPRCPGYIVDEDLWPKLRKKIAGRKAREKRRENRPSPAASRDRAA